MRRKMRFAAGLLAGCLGGSATGEPLPRPTDERAAPVFLPTAIIPIWEKAPSPVSPRQGTMLPPVPIVTRPDARTSISFTAPAGLKVAWQQPDGTFPGAAGALTAPKEYNFARAQTHRLKVTTEKHGTFYPTLEVYPASQKTATFLAHASVPVAFTTDDFAQAKAGTLVVKVIYLPDPAFQADGAVVGAEEVNSTRLEPGADPVTEAKRRGTILVVVRMGNVDLGKWPAELPTVLPVPVRSAPRSSER